MRLDEVTRPSDLAAERAKEEAKIEAMKKRVVAAYTRALTAPQYKPHASDVSHWLFGGGPADPHSMKELTVWTDAIGFMVKVTPSNDSVGGDRHGFRVLSSHLGIPHDLVDFACDPGLPK